MGRCIVCKSEIDSDRMHAIPATRLCVEHGKEIQDFGGEFIMTASQERTSKQGSLKLNYGGVSTTNVRNEDALNRLLDEYERQQFDGPNQDAP